MPVSRFSCLACNWAISGMRRALLQDCQDSVSTKTCVLIHVHLFVQFSRHFMIISSLSKNETPVYCVCMAEKKPFIIIYIDSKYTQMWISYSPDHISFPFPNVIKHLGMRFDSRELNVMIFLYSFQIRFDLTSISIEIKLKF